MDTGAAPVREREYVSYNEASNGQELSGGLNLPGFYCRMTLTFSQKSIHKSGFPKREKLKQ